MKRKMIYGIMLVGLGTGMCALAANNLAKPKPSETIKEPTALVVDSNIPMDGIAKDIVVQDNCFFYLISTPDDEGVVRNYWQVINDTNDTEVFTAEEIRVNKYVVTKTGLNLRALPTTSSEILDTIDYRTEVLSLGSNEDWSLIRYNDKNYFCSTEYLSFERPKVENNTITHNQVNGTYTASQLKTMGVIHWGGWKWTWYSQRVLPGGGLNIPGRHVDANGYVCDAEGYIVLASGALAKGTVVNTPFGKAGKVYDCGCAADTLDVYTDF